MNRAMNEEHLSRETLERMERDELTPRELSIARRHVEGCEECAAQAAAPTPPARWGLLAIAAALAMVVVLTLVGVSQCVVEYHPPPPVNRP